MRRIDVQRNGIVARCCARDPENRYQSAAEILRDLEARKASFVWSRRLRRPGFWLKAAAAVLGIALAVAGAAQGVRFLLPQEQSGPIAVKASPSLWASW